MCLNPLSPHQVSGSCSPAWDLSSELIHPFFEAYAFGMSIDNLFSDKEPRRSLFLKNAHRVRTWFWSPRRCQPLLWCWVWLCCCYGNCSPASMTAGSSPASRESWSRDAGTGWESPAPKTKTCLSVSQSEGCGANVGICLGDFAAGTFLTTNTVKQGNCGKHGREEMVGNSEKKSYGKAKNWACRLKSSLTTSTFNLSAVMWHKMNVRQ